MVFVTVSETYDLSTKIGKMSLIGIHTPSKNIIQKTYPGLCMNSKYCRIVKQDVEMACASMLPADPQQIGVEDGMIAPQDMFNPILFKAVSNESMSTLEYRLHGLGFNDSDNSIHGESVDKTDNVVGNTTDDFGVYYALLSNRDGFRTANPQAGLHMSGLVPLVFEKYYASGNNHSLDQVKEEALAFYKDSGNVGITRFNNLGSMRGRPHPMPRFNTTYITGTGNAANDGVVANGMGKGDGELLGRPLNTQVEMPDILPVYTAAIVMPPCKLNQLYYRMVVRTTLEFTEIRPIQEITSFEQMATQYAPLVYQSDYDTQSTAMTTKLGMVDTAGAGIEKIMEGA